MSNAAAKIKPAECLRHYWELGDNINPAQTKISGVKRAFAFSVHCMTCKTRDVLKSTETCPYCFTTMETKCVDTEVGRFVSPADVAFAESKRVMTHLCQTCSFKCVSFA